MATCLFELRRSFTVQRAAVSVVLALFPPTMFSLLILAMRVGVSSVQGRDARHAAVAVQNIESFSLFMIIFLISLVTLLSLLLWATPNVYSELEGKSWSFVASRPGGRISIFLGKFIASFLVSYGISVISITLCVFLASQLVAFPKPEQLWLALIAIYFLACAGYGAVFSMLGTIFFKRAMVIGAGYLIGSEVFLGTIPALISKLTLRFHLQELGINWMGFFLPFEGGVSEYRDAYGDAWPAWVHVAVLLIASLVALAVGGYIIVSRQYVSKDES